MCSDFTKKLYELQRDFQNLVDDGYTNDFDDDDTNPVDEFGEALAGLVEMSEERDASWNAEEA